MLNPFFLLLSHNVNYVNFNNVEMKVNANEFRMISKPALNLAGKNWKQLNKHEKIFSRPIICQHRDEISLLTFMGKTF